MNDWYLLASLALIAAVVAGLLRVLLFSGLVEKLLALQLLGTASVAVAILLSRALDREGLTDLALLIALLTSVVAIAFVRYIGMSSTARHKGEQQ